MIRFLLFQLIKEKVHRILERFVILANLHGVEHFKKCCEILLFHRCLIVNVADQCRVKEFFRLLPERIPTVSLALCIGHQCRNKLQNVLFIMDVGKWIVVHRLMEVDRVEDPDLVAIFHQGVGGFVDDTPFRIRHHKRDRIFF